MPGLEWSGRTERSWTAAGGWGGWEVLTLWTKKSAEGLSGAGARGNGPDRPGGVSERLGSRFPRNARASPPTPHSKLGPKAGSVEQLTRRLRSRSRRGRFLPSSWEGGGGGGGEAGGRSGGGGAEERAERRGGAHSLPARVLVLRGVGFGAGRAALRALTLYSRSLASHYPAFPGLGLAGARPGQLSGARRRGTLRAEFGWGREIQGPAWLGPSIPASGAPSARQRTGSAGLRAGACARKANPSREGKAMHPCAAPTARAVSER